MRKTKDYTVTAEGRDKGKIFRLTEMPASQAEAWAIRALLALSNAGVNVPDNGSMAAMAEAGINALGTLKWEEAKPLLDEMFGCIQMVPDPSKPTLVRPLIEEDIEEIVTRLKLRFEVWALHADFLQAVAPFVSTQATASPVKGTRNTKTSRRS